MKFKLKSQLFCALVSLPFLLFAQVETIFNNIKLNESLEIVTKKLDKISNSTQLIEVENPIFPLAKEKESHLLCNIIKTENGTITKGIFTFSDNKLTYIETQGNTFNTFTTRRKDTAKTYMNYKVYAKDKLFLNQEKDKAWIMTEEAMHTNLFAWNNPYFDINYKPENSFNTNIPEFITMGEDLEKLKPILEANSSFANTEKLDGTDPNAQLQINCFGVDYLGFPRKVEARFGDHKLNTVWILTAKGEENRIRKALIKQFGKPVFKNDDWEIFDNWKVGLRKDKPEVLLMEQTIGLKYKSSYFKQ